MRVPFDVVASLLPMVGLGLVRADDAKAMARAAAVPEPEASPVDHARLGAAQAKRERKAARRRQLAR